MIVLEDDPACGYPIDGYLQMMPHLVELPMMKASVTTTFEFLDWDVPLAWKFDRRLGKMVYFGDVLEISSVDGQPTRMEATRRMLQIPMPPQYMLDFMMVARTSESVVYTPPTHREPTVAMDGPPMGTPQVPATRDVATSTTSVVDISSSEESEGPCRSPGMRIRDRDIEVPMPPPKRVRFSGDTGGASTSYAPVGSPVPTVDLDPRPRGVLPSSVSRCRHTLSASVPPRCRRCARVLTSDSCRGWIDTDDEEDDPSEDPDA